MKWCLQKLALAAQGDRYLGMTQAVQQDLLWIIGWAVLCVSAVKFALRKGLARYAGIFSVTSLALTLLMASMTSNWTSKLRTPARTTVPAAADNQFTREAFLTAMRDVASWVDDHDPQSIRRGKDFDGFELTIPAGVPLAKERPREPTVAPFSSGVTYYGGDQNRFTRVECFRLSPGYRPQSEAGSRKLVEGFTDEINQQLLDQWTTRFQGATAKRISENGDEAIALDDVNRARMLELWHSTHVAVARRSSVQISGCPGTRTVFEAPQGFPVAARSEILLHGSLLVSVVVGGLTQEDLEHGPADELFRSIKFSR